MFAMYARLILAHKDPFNKWTSSIRESYICRRGDEWCSVCGEQSPKSWAHCAESGCFLCSTCAAAKNCGGCLCCEIIDREKLIALEQEELEQEELER